MIYTHAALVWKFGYCLHSNKALTTVLDSTARAELWAHSMLQCTGRQKRNNKRGQPFHTWAMFRELLSLSRFTPTGFFSQKPGTNGRIQWCSSSLVMLELQLHISFRFRDLIVFVCQCHQINCVVEWRTEPPPPSPSPLSVPPASHISELTHFYLPLLSYPSLSLQFRLSSASFWLLSRGLCSVGAETFPFYSSNLLHDLLWQFSPLVYHLAVPKSF